MSSEVDQALSAMATILKTIDLTNPPGGRVWTHPQETRSISMNTLPAVVVSKMNTQVGSWSSQSFGAGEHRWQMVLACYVADGPVVVTSTDELTIQAMENANEWYKIMSDLLFENMTLSGTVDMLGDDDGNLFEYVTDNILWDGQQYYGHLFLVPVRQTVIQGVSS